MCLRSTLLHPLVRVALLHLVGIRGVAAQKLPAGVAARPFRVHPRLLFALAIARAVLASGTGTHARSRSNVNFEFANSSQHLCLAASLLFGSWPGDASTRRPPPGQPTNKQTPDIIETIRFSLLFGGWPGDASTRRPPPGQPTNNKCERNPRFAFSFRNSLFFPIGFNFIFELFLKVIDFYFCH